MTGRERLAWVLLGLAALAVYLPGLDRPLRDAEAKYAQVPREMLETGDWLTPRLDGARYYVKPPLGYWPTAALFAVAGPSEAAARLTNVASALVAAFLIGLLARRLFGPTPGLLSGALFLLTTEVYVYCLDAGLEFWLIACQVLAFLFLWRGSLFGFHAALGLGFLVKGLPGVLIPLAAAALADPRRAMRLLHPRGLAGLALVAGPWLAWMAFQHPDFFEVFVVNEHLRRFTGRMASNDALFPTGLWLVLVAAEFFPWILHLPGAGRELARMVRANAVAREKAVFLGAWAALPLVLYALSRSKVDFYGLEIYPPLLIGVAVPLADLLGERRFASGRRWALPWLGVSGVAATCLLVLLLARNADWFLALEIPSPPAAAVFLSSASVLGLGAGLAFLRERPRLALGAVALLCAVLFQVQRVTFEAGFEHSSMKFAADLLEGRLREGDLLISDERSEFEHVAALAWYTGRPVQMLRDRESSIMHFIEPDRNALCMDEPELVAEVCGGRTTYLVAETEPTPARLAELGLDGHSLGSASDRSLFALACAP